MSENQKPTVITTAGEPTPEQQPEEKLSFVAKSKQFVKNHKRPAIAVGALVGLVGVAALAGRRQEPLPALVLEIEPPHASVDLEPTEPETETTTA